MNDISFNLKIWNEITELMHTHTPGSGNILWLWKWEVEKSLPNNCSALIFSFKNIAARNIFAVHEMKIILRE